MKETAITAPSIITPMPSTDIFDITAASFATAIDVSIARDTYLRGTLFVEAVRRVAPAGARVLDLGCGPGRIAMLLARQGYWVTGVDPSEGMVNEARRQRWAGSNLHFEVGRPDRVPPAERPFDVVVCSSVIEYVTDACAFLGDVVGALNREGAFVVSFANRSSLWRKYAVLRFPDKPHLARQHHVWDFGAFRCLLREAGLAPSRPVYFESPLDEGRLSRVLGRSRWIGTLGLVTARRVEASRST